MSSSYPFTMQQQQWLDGVGALRGRALSQVMPICKVLFGRSVSACIGAGDASLKVEQALNGLEGLGIPRLLSLETVSGHEIAGPSVWKQSVAVYLAVVRGFVGMFSAKVYLST